ncbi:MAG: hypothetical protein ACI89J_001471 [Hyphomicrobiaceae bacterium]|jgi:hypothetical protein
MSSDPVNAITEADATDDVAALYAEIRSTLGVPVVNLIWRHLATLPGALPWAWSSLKPLYENGTIAAEAQTLRAAIDLPPHIAASPALNLPTLTAAGLTSEDVAQITMIVRSYERSNALNIVAATTLYAALDGQQFQQSIQREPSKTTQPEAPIIGEMPQVLSPADMSPSTRTLVATLNTFGARTDILPTMYRHLAHWPPALALIHDLLAPEHGSGRLEALIQEVLANSHERAMRISGQLASPACALDPVSARATKNALASFSQGPLCRMIAITALIRAAMSEQG